ncbi:XkdQ/YqbQ family protein [Acutalibacter intestini]|uniref:XkdQ/YqbQ family protein n=1 Tax=Acutalibacter intestini TaxID=3093659 RepID=UPI002AC9CB13|nr:hypothetical protein [Acutalibacter sp. M00204]
MKVELLIANNATGAVVDAAPCVQSATYTTNRTGSPGTLEFTLNKAGNISFVEGDTVRFTVDGTLVFYGWVFTKSKDRWGVVSVTCYDRLRYLKASASYAFYGRTAGEIIREIAGDFQLDLGEIADTGYRLPSLIEEEQTCLDIIDGAIQQTLLNTGAVYVFFDNGRGLSLKKAGDMKAEVMVGDRSLLTNYTYKTDIDSQTYNSVKLARPNEKTGRADVFIAQDSAHIGRWGLLQLYQSIDGDLNDAQAKAQAAATLGYYNQRMRTLSVSSLGVLGLRAGMMLYMRVKGLGDINLDQYVLLEKVTHTFKNDEHTMDFDTLAL